MCRIKMKRVRPQLFQRLKSMWSILVGVLTLMFPNTEQIASRNRSDVVLKKLLAYEFLEIPSSIDNLSPLENTSITSITSDPDGIGDVFHGPNELHRTGQTKIRTIFKNHRITESNSSCFDSQNCSLSVTGSNNPESNLFEECSNNSNTHRLSMQSSKTISSSRFSNTTDRLIEASTSSAFPLKNGTKNSSLLFLSPEVVGVTSCHGRCGEKVHLPCSCADVCLITGNCCLDIKEKCPALVIAGRSKFSHLLQARVECSSVTATFMVMDCPSEIRSETVHSHKELTDSEEKVDEATVDAARFENLVTQSVGSVQREVAGQNNFLSLMYDAPITDLSTQLVYKNRSVALCNRVPESHIIPWKIKIKLATSTKPQSLEDINKFTDTNYFDYIAPDLLQSSKGIICITASVRQCQNQWLVLRPELEALCHNGGITYYLTKAYLSVIYDNFYCMLCNEGYEGEFTPLVGYSSFERYFRLSLVASFSSGGILKISSVGSLGMVTWDTLNCSLSKTEQGESQCRDFECKKNTEMRIGEACKKITHIQFAISEGLCTFPRSQIMESELLALITCYLEISDNAVFISDNVRFDTVYDKRLGLPLLRVSVRVHYPGLRFAVQREQVWTELAMLVRSAKFPCDPVLDRVECAAGSCRIGDLLVPEVTSLDAASNAEVKASMPDLNNAIETTTDSWTIFCESNVYSNKKEVKGLMCFQVHETVSPQFELSERAGKLSCFRGNFSYRRALRMRNNVFLRLPGRCLVFSVLISFIKINMFPY